jgi:hypothetical protein
MEWKLEKQLLELWQLEQKKGGCKRRSFWSSPEAVIVKLPKPAKNKSSIKSQIKTESQQQ